MSRMLSAEILHTLDIPHPHYERVERQLYTQLSMGAPGSVILLVGPTRVGKSRLIRRVADQLITGIIENDDKPIAAIEAATTVDGRFSMRHLTLRALEELAHPLVDVHGLTLRMRESETQLRIKLEKAIRFRKTRFLIVDEAHHMLRTNRARVAADALDSLKCLANTTGLVLLLAGGYELFSAGLTSAHLNGRMRVIEFGRYRNEGQDQRDFLGIMNGLDAYLPWRSGQSLLAHVEFMQLGTLGCLGLLLQWINAALCEMAACGERRLDIAHFGETRFEEQIRTIAQEIEAGEFAMKKLRVTKRVATAGHVVAATSSKSARRRPFTRKPKRDKVGQRGL